MSMSWRNLRKAKEGDLLVFKLHHGKIYYVRWMKQIDWRMGCLMVRCEETGKIYVPGFDGYLLGVV